MLFLTFTVSLGRREVLGRLTDNFAAGRGWAERRQVDPFELPKRTWVAASAASVASPFAGVAAVASGLGSNCAGVVPWLDSAS